MLQKLMRKRPKDCKLMSKSLKDCLTLISAHWKFCVIKVNLVSDGVENDEARCDDRACVTVMDH